MRNFCFLVALSCLLTGCDWKEIVLYEYRVLGCSDKKLILIPNKLENKNYKVYRDAKENQYCDGAISYTLKDDHHLSVSVYVGPVSETDKCVIRLATVVASTKLKCKEGIQCIDGIRSAAEVLQFAELVLSALGMRVDIESAKAKHLGNATRYQEWCSKVAEI